MENNESIRTQVNERLIPIHLKLNGEGYNTRITLRDYQEISDLEDSRLASRLNEHYPDLSLWLSKKEVSLEQFKESFREYTQKGRENFYQISESNDL